MNRLTYILLFFPALLPAQDIDSLLSAIRTVYNAQQQSIIALRNTIDEKNRVIDSLEQKVLPGYVVPHPDELTGEHGNALTRFFDSVPDGTEVRFPEGATYNCTFPVMIHSKTDLTIRGNGATLVFQDDAATANLDSLSRRLGNHIRRLWPRNRYHIFLDHCNDIRLSGFQVQGPKADTTEYVSGLEAQHGICIERCENIVVENVQVRDVYGDAAYVGGVHWERQNKNIVLRDFSGENIGRQGIAIVAGENIYIHDVTLKNVWRSAFDVEPNSDKSLIDNIFIWNTYTNGVKNSLLANKGYGQGRQRLYFLYNRSTGSGSFNALIKNNREHQIRREKLVYAYNSGEELGGNPHKAFCRTNSYDTLVIVGNEFHAKSSRKMHTVRDDAPQFGARFFGENTVTGDKATDAILYPSGKVAKFEPIPESVEVVPEWIKTGPPYKYPGMKKEIL